MKNLSGSEQLQIILINCSIKLTLLRSHKYYPLRDVERNDKDASKPVARHFNLPNHSKQHMAFCSLSSHLGSSESCKTLEQKFILQIGTSSPRYQQALISFN